MTVTSLLSDSESGHKFKFVGGGHDPGPEARGLSHKSLAAT